MLITNKDQLNEVFTKAMVEPRGSSVCGASKTW